MPSIRTPNQKFADHPMDQLNAVAVSSATEWLWHGIIARRNITLLTSRWKAGKTTLLTGLLQSLAAGGDFLGRAVTPAKALVISEESVETWADRMQRMPVGPHARLISRPFLLRPSPEQWHQLVEQAAELASAGNLDLLVIDPLARFLPGASESDTGAIFDLLQPLQQLAEYGPGVLILHHPRKKRSDEGSSARGAGALLAAVDVIAELSYYGALRGDECRRQLYAVSRYPETQRRLVYEWDPATGIFSDLGDPATKRFKENWERLRAILADRKSAATHHELLMDWPDEPERPTPRLLYEWLNRAYKAKLVRRVGAGREQDPYRFRLPNEDDEYRDRGELPPLRGLDGIEPLLNQLGLSKPAGRGKKRGK
jgi:hypothetical protein